MKQFDLISDMHVDFWLKKKGRTKEDHQKELNQFVDDLLPDEISDVIAIAGDLGHNNNQNLDILKSLKRYYKYILIVPGNHDYYLIDSTARYKFSRNSLNRWKNMKELGSSLEGVHFLEGTTINIDGVTFGGTGMWYDFSYGIQRLNKSITSMYDVWNNGMNDEKYIFGLPRRPLQWFWHEKQLLEKILDDSDVIITHISPDSSKVLTKYEIDPMTGCYYFDGSEYSDRLYGKIWAFGHTHHHYSYTEKGCWFVNNALGYPKEEDTGLSKIVNLPLESMW